MTITIATTDEDEARDLAGMRAWRQGPEEIR